jgi:hypothetical protein
VLVATTFCIVEPLAKGQGTVNFANASTVPGWVDPNIDRYVRWSVEAPWYYPGLVPGSLVTTNSAGYSLNSLRAALYYSASTDYNLDDFVAASGGTSSLRSSSSTTAGSWFGHMDTLDTIPAGVTANLVVFVWDTSVNADPRSAYLQGGISGWSSIFQYTPPTSASPLPSELLMNGLTTFQAPWVPEPSPMAFCGVGAIIFVIYSRYRARG